MLVTVIAAFLATFLVGVLVGLLVGPATDRVQNAYSQGFMEGVACMAKEPTP